MTGHKGTFVMGTTPCSLNVIEIEPSEETVTAIAGPHLGLAVGSGMPYEPGEILENGEYMVTYEDNNNTHFVDADSVAAGTGVVKCIRKVQTFTWTKPAPAGMSNGATRSFSGFVMSSKESTQKTGDRNTKQIKVKVSGSLTKTPAS